MLSAQTIDYLAKAREFLANGDCERARYAYEDYKKKVNPAGNAEVKRLIEECGKNESCPSILYDHDGNSYRTVQIGNQCWMAQNLRTEYDRAGNKLDQFLPPDGKQSNVKTYGYLYDWYTARDICPYGWHLPSSDEWWELIGGCEAIGELTGGAQWKSSSGKTGYREGYPGDYSYAKRNRTGFNALPAGEYSWGDGVDEGYWDYCCMTEAACFWTSTETDTETALGYEEDEPFYFMSDKVWLIYEMPSKYWSPPVWEGFRHSYYSVRCLKD